MTTTFGPGTILLIAGGVLSILVALLHFVVIFYGAPGYRYFGAGETLATMAEKGSPIPGIVTFGIGVVFLVFAAYAFAAADVMPTLPWLFWGIFGVSAVYTLRGLGVLAPLFMRNVSSFDKVSSAVSLAIGLVHFSGLYWGRIAGLLAH